MKTAGGKKRSREEAAGSAGGSTPPVYPPRPNPNKEWKKSKAKTEDLLALLNSGFLREKEVDMWRTAAGDPYPMEKNPDEIPMFTRFVERGVGEFRKTRHPRNVEFNKVLEACFSGARNSRFSEAWNL
jgi:hypothetical protein